MAQGALFRFGFICFGAAEEPAGGSTWAELRRSWRRLALGEIVIYHHPETRVRTRERNGAFAVLIGEAFSERKGEALDEVLDALCGAEGDAIPATLDRLSGRFALLSMREGERRAFHDPVGSRSLAYRAEGAFCIASHPELAADAFGDRRDPEVTALMRSPEYRSRSVKYLPGDLTVYEGVRALAPNCYYDIEARRTVRYWPRERCEAASFDEFFTALDTDLGALAAHLRGRHTPVLGVTGGIDTRTVMAAFRHHGLPFKGLTWLRRGGGIDERERRVAEAVATELEIEHTYLDVADAEDPEGIAALSRRNVGRYARPAPITAELHARFAGTDALFVRGYAGELIRGFYNRLDRPPRSARGRLRAWGVKLRLAPPRRPTAAIDEPTPRALLDAYNTSMGAERASAEYERRALAAFEGFAERAHYDRRLTDLGYDLSDLFYWEHRMGAWAAGKLNEMDAAMPSLVGYNSRGAFIRAFGLDPGERLKKELLREVIGRYDERLAEIPFL